MKPIALAILVALACACRRTHVAPSYESDTPPTAAPPAAPAQATAPSDTAESAPEPPAPPIARARLPDGGTLNGDPRGPRPAVWQAIVDGVMPALQACFDRAELPPGTIAVAMHYTVERPGYTGAVTATGPAPKEVLDCCVNVVESLKFPEYRGDKVERDLSFTWSKHLVGRPDGGAAAPEKP